MRKSKTKKGITLIALIITIVVLLILAVVTINAIQGDGIIQYAKNAQTDYTDAANKEQEDLNVLEGQIGEAIGEGNTKVEIPQIALADATDDTMLDKKTNSATYDIYGNKIVVPAGFKILVDNTGYTEEDISVTKGVVIQDKAGNEFVWVPVGKIYKDEAKTEENAETITLGRYESFDKNENEEYVPKQKAKDYVTQINIWDSPRDTICTEDTADNHNDDNVIAKSIKDFCLNSITNSGYYIGRYEAGDLEATKAETARTEETSDENTLVCKADQQVYNYVTQPKAANLSRNMYKDATTFTSDLINSYAWDTAIIFIQTFSKCTNYHEQNFSKSFAITGANKDVYCNIHDMSGNAWELSTETHKWGSCVSRGGCFSVGPGAYLCTSYRANGSMSSSNSSDSFRPILYL